MIPILLIGAAYLIGKTMEGKTYSNGGIVLLLAPNGKPSNLNEAQWHLVRTPKFKAWFGDWENDSDNASKVVDENGEPLVVYHYSPNEFTIFDKTKHPQFVDVVENKKHKPLGYDFSTREGFYESKTRNKKYSVFLNAKNVFNFSKATENEYQKIIKLLSKIPYYSTHSFQLDLDIKYLKSGDWGLLERPTLEKYFSKNFDGLFMLENDWLNIKVYNSNQIKLADGSNATFDSSNPDIRYNDGGKLSSLKSLEQLDYQLRYPKENKLLFLDADKLLKRHSIDNPSFDITLKENQIGNRVQKAKDYITDYLLDNRWINRRTNERENIKIKFEPSIAGIYNGKLGFEDGRHRVLAAKELGFKKVAVEVPKGQVAEFEKYFN